MSEIIKPAQDSKYTAMLEWLVLIGWCLALAATATLVEIASNYHLIQK